jgi:hypothetical protein
MGGFLNLSIISSKWSASRSGLSAPDKISPGGVVRQVTLSLGLTKHHVMKTYGGMEAKITDLDTGLGVMSGGYQRFRNVGNHLPYHAVTLPKRPEHEFSQQ